MRKTLVNHWVDMVTGVAFLFCALTGIVRLFPSATAALPAACP